MSKGLGRVELSVLSLVARGAWTVREATEAIPGAHAQTVQRAFRTLYKKGKIHLLFRPVLTASAPAGTASPAREAPPAARQAPAPIPRQTRPVQARQPSSAGGGSAERRDPGGSRRATHAAPISPAFVAPPRQPNAAPIRHAPAPVPRQAPAPMPRPAQPVAPVIMRPKLCYMRRLKRSSLAEAGFRPSWRR
jgi:hypothetical protein